MLDTGKPPLDGAFGVIIWKEQAGGVRFFTNNSNPKNPKNPTPQNVKLHSIELWIDTSKIPTSNASPLVLSICPENITSRSSFPFPSDANCHRHELPPLAPAPRYHVVFQPKHHIWLSTETPWWIVLRSSSDNVMNGYGWLDSVNGEAYNAFWSTETGWVPEGKRKTSYNAKVWMTGSDNEMIIAMS